MQLTVNFEVILPTQNSYFNKLQHLPPLQTLSTSVK